MLFQRLKRETPSHDVFLLAAKIQNKFEITKQLIEKKLQSQQECSIMKRELSHVHLLFDNLRFTIY